MKKGFAFLSLSLLLLSGVGFVVSQNTKENKIEKASALTNYGYASGEYQYYTGSYYDSVGDSAINSGGTTLLSALCTKIQPSSQYGYDALWSLYLTSDVYPNNYDGTDPLTGNSYPTTKTASEYGGKIWDMYGDTQYTPGGSAQGANYKKVGDAYNREHTVPQSWFSESAIPKSDPHHVVATDGYVNNQRGNLPYGEVNGTKNVLTNGFGGTGSPVTTYGSCGSSEVFEPEDAYKGDFARGILYMAAAYYNYSTSFANSNSCFTRSGNYNLLSSYYINLLTKWSAQDPVSQKEIDRNNVIFNSSQGNRNPFIDHPNWAYKIWGGTQYTWNNGSTSSSDPSATISPSSTSVAVDGTVNLTATLSNVTNASLISWTSSDTSKATVSKGTTTTSSSSATVTGVASGSVTIYCKYNSTTIGSANITVTSSGSSGGGESESSYTITSSDCPESYPTTATEYTASSGLKFYAYNVMNQNNNVQFKKSGGYLYNSSSINLSSLTMESVSGTFTVYAGSSKNPSSTTISAVGNSYNLSGYNYFKIINNSSSVASCSSLTIYTASSSTKTLSSISLNTENVKTTFDVDDTFDYTGLVVTANYSDSSSETVTPTSVSSPDMSTSGTKEITVSYTEGSVTKTATYNITVNAASQASDSTSLSKVFSEMGIANTTTMTTISFYSSNSQTITGTFDKGSNNNNAPIYYSNGSAVRMYPNNTLTITSSKANLISIVFTFGTSDGSNTITVDTGTYSNGTWTGTASSVTFTIGGSSGHRRIASVTVSYYGAENYASYFVTNIGCNSAGTSKPSGSWSTLSSKYSTLFTDDQNALKNATYTKSGSGNSTVVTPGTGISQNVANCVARYDLIVSKYGTSQYSNFMSRTVSSTNNPMIIKQNNTSIIVVVLCMSCLSLAALSIFVIKKKKTI